MAVNSVCVCRKCKQAFTKGETSCPICGGELILTRFTTLYWDKCTDADREDGIKQYLSNDPNAKVVAPVVKSYTVNTGEPSGGLMGMITNGFKTMLSVAFIIFVVSCGIWGTIIGYRANYNAGGGFLGLLIGLAIGIFIGIELCGYFATIIHISDTNDQILKYLKQKEK